MTLVDIESEEEALILYLRVKQTKMTTIKMKLNSKLLYARTSLRQYSTLQDIRALIAQTNIQDNNFQMILRK